MSDELFDIGLQAVSLTADLPDPIITVSGANSYTVDNTAEYHILGLSIHGKSTQDGTPTPTTPVDIVSVGDSGTVEITACGKNLFPWNDYTAAPISVNTTAGTTRNDVIINSNVIKINIPQGVNPSWGVYISAKLINKILLAQTGKVITLSCTVKSNYNVKLIFGLNDRNKIYNVTTNENKISNTFAYDGPQRSNDMIWYARTDSNDAELQISNIQIEIGDTATDYEPCKCSTASITTALPLCGIPVDSGGNYTDSNGQQWVCDELIYNADGTGKIVKHTGKTVFDGSDDERWAHATINSEFTNDLRIQFVKLNGTLAENINSSSTFLYCNRLQYNNKTIWNTDVSGCKIASRGDLIVRMPSSIIGGNDVTAFKSWLANNPLTIVYQTVPQEIELTTEEMAELKTLQSYDNITNVYNNSGADMTVKILRRDFDMQYVFWIEESQTWTCPIGGKWKIICVGGGASGGQQYGTGAVLYGAGGTTSFGSIISAEGGAAADKLSERIVYGQGGYDGVSYGWAPGSSAIGTGVNSQAHGYGGGGYATQTNLSVTGPSSTLTTKVASGLCGKIKSTIVDLAESQSIICTIGDGGVLDITDSALKQYLMAANPSITAVATTATEFNAAAGKGKKGLIIAQYLGY